MVVWGKTFTNRGVSTPAIRCSLDGSVSGWKYKSTVGSSGYAFADSVCTDLPGAGTFGDTALDFGIYSDLTFEKPDITTFRNLGLAYEAMNRGGNAPVC